MGLFYFIEIALFIAKWKGEFTLGSWEWNVFSTTTQQKKKNDVMPSVFSIGII